MKAVLPIVILFSAQSVPAKDGEPGAPPPPPPAIETGVASWYGYPYHGRHAADGEIYDMEKLTAAHRTLPFGTRVRVVNLKNEKSVEVRITDRGPFVDGRVIDLSKAAAREVDMLAAGVSPVRLEVMGREAVPGREKAPGGAPAPDCFAVQVGAFQDARNARRFLGVMKARYGSGRIVVREGDPTLYRVLVGSEATPEGAAELAGRIRQELGQGTAFVARVDHP